MTSPFSSPKTKTNFGRLLVWWLDLSDPDPQILRQIYATDCQQQWCIYYCIIENSKSYFSIFLFLRIFLSYRYRTIELLSVILNFSAATAQEEADLYQVQQQPSPSQVQIQVR